MTMVAGFPNLAKMVFSCVTMLEDVVVVSFCTSTNLSNSLLPVNSESLLVQRDLQLYAPMGNLARMLSLMALWTKVSIFDKLGRTVQSVL